MIVIVVAIIIGATLLVLSGELSTAKKEVAALKKEKVLLQERMALCANEVATLKEEKRQHAIAHHGADGSYFISSHLRFSRYNGRERTEYVSQSPFNNHLQDLAQ